MVCRDKTRGEEAQQELLEASPNKEVHLVHLHLLDMSMPRKVWEFALNFAASGKTLNVLVNNAGCMVNERVVSEDGLEKNFATNTLGTYILTTGLISTLEKSEEPRIITVSSGGVSS
jgi:dehydrogenase/reductase SDR family protein 12